MISENTQTTNLTQNAVSSSLSIQDRIDIVNQIIDLISVKSRRFFFSKTTNCTAKIIHKNGFVYFIDQYSRVEIPLHLSAGLHWNHFSHGGTIKGLVLDFYDYISTGKKSNHNNGYGGLYCPHWGYSESDMKEIQDFALLLGYL
jgi:hypothetical protein